MLIPWTPSGGLGHRSTLVVGGLGADGRGFAPAGTDFSATIAKPFSATVEKPFVAGVEKPFSGEVQLVP